MSEDELRALEDMYNRTVEERNSMFEEGGFTFFRGNMGNECRRN